MSNIDGITNNATFDILVVRSRKKAILISLEPRFDHEIFLSENINRFLSRAILTEFKSTRKESKFKTNEIESSIIRGRNIL